jgi:hypothetical protein
MIRLIIAIAVGAIVAVGGVFGVQSALDSSSKGAPSNSPLQVYAYGNR